MKFAASIELSLARSFGAFRKLLWMKPIRLSETAAVARLPRATLSYQGLTSGILEKIVVAQFRLRVRLGLRQCRNCTIPCLAKKDSLNVFGGPARIHRASFESERPRRLEPPIFSWLKASDASALCSSMDSCIWGRSSAPHSCCAVPTGGRTWCTGILEG